MFPSRQVCRGRLSGQWRCVHSWRALYADCSPHPKPPCGEVLRIGLKARSAAISLATTIRWWNPAHRKHKAAQRRHGCQHRCRRDAARLDREVIRSRWLSQVLPKYRRYAPDNKGSAPELENRGTGVPPACVQQRATGFEYTSRPCMRKGNPRQGHNESAVNSSPLPGTCSHWSLC